MAITLHNIHEGLAVGVAFGAQAHHLSGATLSGAFALALGIGRQNFPEGTAVSIPLCREGMSRWKSFVYGQSSGIVEPIAGVFGTYAVVEELILAAYTSVAHSHTEITTVGCMLGFSVTMILDVAPG